MLQIPCPCCGLRDEVEFVFGGPADLHQPDPDHCSDEQWADYLFNRDNPKGQHHERWCHRHGCGGWFSLLRDTVSHQIVQIDPPDGADP